MVIVATLRAHPPPQDPVQGDLFGNLYDQRSIELHALHRKDFVERFG
jgi:hypothetical protein